MSKLEEALENMPESGGGGCHPHLMTCANHAVIEDISEEEFVAAVRPHLRGERKVSDHEVREAYQKAISTFDPSIRKSQEMIKIDISALSTVTEAELSNVNGLSPEVQTQSFIAEVLGPQDLIYAGPHKKKVTARDIRPAVDLQNDNPPGPFFCVNPLTGKAAKKAGGKDGESSFRCDNAVADHRFMLVEFDESTPEEQRAICKTFIDLGCVASITHSAGKSYHVLLKVSAASREDYDRIKETLKPLLIGLGADRACFNPSHLSRLPGARRPDKNNAVQRLIYLNGEAKANIEGLLERFKPVEKESKSKLIEEEIKKLLHASPIEKELGRKRIKEKYGLSIKAIDQTIKALKTKPVSIVEDLETWPESVEGAMLLDEIKALILRHVVLEKDTDAITIALWVMLSYCYDSFPILPNLAIQSPEKRCGKTTMLDLLFALVMSGLSTCNITPAAVFRTIDKYRPCLLIDEADTFLKENDDMRGLLNSGHRKVNAQVIRTAGDQHEPTVFRTWAPKAIALIGELYDTLRDRSIVVSMRRKLRTEVVSKVPLSLYEDCLDLRRKLARWSEDNAEVLRKLTPTIPQTGNDRQDDNWTPLFTIAQQCGKGWPESVKKALLAVLADSGDDEDTLNIRLLKDIETIFSGLNGDRILSSELVRRLLAIEDAPWQTYGYGKGLNQNSLARMLKHFKVRPKTIRIRDDRAKGYDSKQFEEPFERYLSSSTHVSNVEHRDKSTTIRARGTFQTVTSADNVTDENPRKRKQGQGCHGDTGKKGGSGKEEEKNKDFRSVKEEDFEEFEDESSEKKLAAWT